jgi:hypothetical protein
MGQEIGSDKGLRDVCHHEPPREIPAQSQVKSLQISSNAITFIIYSFLSLHVAIRKNKERLYNKSICIGRYL